MGYVTLAEHKFEYNPLGCRGSAGYWLIPYSDVKTKELRRDHPHRLNAAWLLRIPLAKGMVVHHRDGDKDNNHVSNLVAGITPVEHIALHRRNRVTELKGRVERLQERLKKAQTEQRVEVQYIEDPWAAYAAAGLVD